MCCRCGNVCVFFLYILCTSFTIFNLTIKIGKSDRFAYSVPPTAAVSFGVTSGMAHSATPQRCGTPRVNNVKTTRSAAMCRLVIIIMCIDTASDMRSPLHPHHSHSASSLAVICGDLRFSWSDLRLTLCWSAVICGFQADRVLRLFRGCSLPYRLFLNASAVAAKNTKFGKLF